MMGSRRFSLCMYAVVWIGVALLLAAAGLYMDDYHYLHEFIGSHHYDVSFDFCEGAPITSVSQAVRSSWLHYFYWGNGRLGSAIMFFLNLLPRWLWPPLHATAFTCMLWLLIRLIAGKSMRPLLWIGILASVWIVFPWHENMVASTYFINYVWTACLNLWLLYLLIPLSGRHIRRPVGALRATALMLLALCAATMHEGLSVVTDMYLFLLWLRLIRLWKRVSAFDRRAVRRNILLLSAVFSGLCRRFAGSHIRPFRDRTRLLAHQSREIYLSARTDLLHIRTELAPDGSPSTFDSHSFYHRTPGIEQSAEARRSPHPVGVCRHTADVLCRQRVPAFLLDVSRLSAHIFLAHTEPIFASFLHALQEYSRLVRTRLLYAMDGSRRLHAVHLRTQYARYGAACGRKRLKSHIL